MATYAFETITAQQALTVTSADTITVMSGTATQTTVLFGVTETDAVSITIGSRTVMFKGLPYSGAIISSAPLAPFGEFVFADGTALFIGGLSNDTVNLNPNGSTRTGAAYGYLSSDSFSGAGGWLIQGNQGNDVVTMSAGNNTIYGGQDNDIIQVGVGNNFANGNKGNDTLTGSAGIDSLLGGQGNDHIDGAGDQDILDGNLGDDVITGSGLLLGEGGSDTLTASFTQLATLSGGDGDDRLVIGFTRVGEVRQAVPGTANGDAGDDTIESTSLLSDTLSGGAGNDVINGVGNESGDVIDGGDGDDTVTGMGASNLIQGGAGNDRVVGANASGLAPNDGRDTLDGGAGADTLAGGLGPDILVLDDATTGPVIAPEFADKIMGWGSDDRIQLRAHVSGPYLETTAADIIALRNVVQSTMGAGQADLLAVQVNGDVYVFADVAGTNAPEVYFLLVGRSLADISADNFL